jgi:phosphoribosylformylglycinamidine (FGAM) synthase PurS component
MRRAVAISLKIPDNTAYTALVALRRLDVPVERIERCEIYFFNDDGNVEALKQRIEADERIFNPNLHRLAVLDSHRPGRGEVWIEPLASQRVTLSRVEGRAATAWRLFDAQNRPVSHGVLAVAAERLLCNPAIDRAITEVRAG